MAQSLSNVLVHFVFSTKNRFAFLPNVEHRRRMHRYLARVFKEHGCPALEVGGVADHVHLLCALSRNCTMSEVIKQAKSNSSSWVKTLGGMLQKFAWQGGYGAFSAHPTQIGQIKEYIRNQVEHHRVRTFQEEYLDLLREYGVSYDEKYLWT
ncbi:MAG: IS200/IS605 family transposase [Deltaproteobacteria bacterium]|nr:IS200/IS605 family transposase [Deltaproteobacteria bacterium]